MMSKLTDILYLYNAKYIGEMSVICWRVPDIVETHGHASLPHLRTKNNRYFAIIPSLKISDRKDRKGANCTFLFYRKLGYVVNYQTVLFRINIY